MAALLALLALQLLAAAAGHVAAGARVGDDDEPTVATQDAVGMGFNIYVEDQTRVMGLSGSILEFSRTLNKTAWYNPWTGETVHPYDQVNVDLTFVDEMCAYEFKTEATWAEHTVDVDDSLRISAQLLPSAGDHFNLTGAFQYDYQRMSGWYRDGLSAASYSNCTVIRWAYDVDETALLQPGSIKAEVVEALNSLNTSGCYRTDPSCTLQVCKVVTAIGPFINTGARFGGMYYFGASVNKAAEASWSFSFTEEELTLAIDYQRWESGINGSARVNMSDIAAEFLANATLFNMTVGGNSSALSGPGGYEAWKATLPSNPKLVVTSSFFQPLNEFLPYWLGGYELESLVGQFLVDYIGLQAPTCDQFVQHFFPPPSPPPPPPPLAPRSGAAASAHVNPMAYLGLDPAQVAATDRLVDAVRAAKLRNIPAAAGRARV